MVHHGDQGGHRLDVVRVVRAAHRIDANQTAIVKGLREAGLSVAVTSMLGKGFPDLVAGLRMRNFMFEIKDGSLPPSRRKLTPDEEAFHRAWKGEIVVVGSLEEALDHVHRR